MNATLYDRRPARPGRPTRRTAPARGPFAHASPQAITLLVSMVLTREEATNLLQTLGDDAEVAQLRIGAVCRCLAELAGADGQAGALLDAIFEVRLGVLARPFETDSIFALARIWADARDTIGGPEAAALLWRIARSRSPLYRRLEDAVVDELLWRGARTVYEPCVGGVCPRR